MGYDITGGMQGLGLRHWDNMGFLRVYSGYVAVNTGMYQSM